MSESKTSDKGKAFEQPSGKDSGESAEPEAALPAHRITRRAVTGWVLYDLANTIFSMGVISLNLPLWIRQTAGANRADALYGTITAIAMALIFFASPLLGAMTDRARRRMPFLVTSTLLAVIFTALLGRGGLFLTAAFFVVANVAYQAGSQFYDALLPEVSTEENRGRIGGMGVGIGYLGSYVAVGLSLAFASRHMPSLFLCIALAFLLFALPCFVFVKERGNPNPRPINWTMVRNSTRETMATLRSGRQYPGLLRFLIGRVFYTDAINTVISIMALYTVNVAVSSGLGEDQGQKQAKIIMLFAITFAIAGGFIWGWLTDRHGPKRALEWVLRCWMAIFVGAALVGLCGLPLWSMYAVAACAGFCLGGVWAADRPYMLRLTPPWRIGEFYGLYGMVGRFSAVTGPALWALVTHFMNRMLVREGSVVSFQKKAEIARISQSVAVLVLLLMVIVSYLILRRVSDQPPRWAKTRGETLV